MSRSAAKRSSKAEFIPEGEEDRGERLYQARRGCAVVVEHRGRRYVVLADRRGLSHAREIMADGRIAESIEDEEFDMLADAFPWEA